MTLYFNIFHDFPLFVSGFFGFGAIEFKCVWLLFFDKGLKFSSVKTEMSKSGLSLINLQGSKAFTRQLPSTWLAMWLSHFDFDVILTAFQVILKTYSLHRKSSYSELFWYLRISPYSVRLRENAGKMRTRITPNTDTFYAVTLIFHYHNVSVELTRFSKFSFMGMGLKTKIRRPRICMRIFISQLSKLK